jgi:hypothetical protein
MPETDTTVSKLNPMARGFFDRLRLAIDTESAYGRLASWITNNTMLDGKLFSFKDHEFQEAIINDTHRRQVIRKCSQVGLSEAAAREAIGSVATSRGSHFIYALPTKTFASSFSTSRIQPIIDESEVVRAMTTTGAAMSAHLKKIGTSYLHIGGTSGSTNGAISVPAKKLVFDEFDFCDMRIAGQYESRLKHAPECPTTHVKGWIKWFSTPTLPHYGVDAKFQNSDQKHYHVDCDCGHTFAPAYTDIRIPGTPKDWKIATLTKDEVSGNLFDFKRAYMACPVCHKDVWDELCNPKKRRWIAKKPLVTEISGWQVHPWDCPRVNSIPSVILQMVGYENQADFMNFGIGLPFEDSTNSFLSGPVLGLVRCPWNPDGGQGYFMGVDVGRTSHIVIGKPVNLLGKIRLQIHYLERFRSSKEKPLPERVKELMKLYGVRCNVMDSQPDFSAVNAVAARYPNTTFGCEYTESRPSSELSNLRVITEANIVKAYRTGSLNELMKANNGGQIVYPQMINDSVKVEVEEIAENFKNIKKVRAPDKKTGVMKESYIKLDGNDHYTHAINYLLMAVEIKGVLALSAEVPAPMGINTFTPLQHDTAKPSRLIGSYQNIRR